MDPDLGLVPCAADHPATEDLNRLDTHAHWDAAAYTEHVLSYLDRTHAGHSPEGRLLALACVLRARRNGTFNLSGEDLEPDRLDLPDWAPNELTDCGWLEADPSRINATVRPASHTTCRIPGLADGDNTGVPSGSKLNGWALHILAHPILCGQPAAVRLAAVYVTAMSNHRGHARITPRHMAGTCRTPARQAPELLHHLKTAGWLSRADLDVDPGRSVLVTIAPPARHLAPGAPPAEATGPRPNPINLRGREHEVAAWVDAYVARHHHGPPHRELLAAHCTENTDVPWPAAWIAGAVQRLADQGWLYVDGSRWYRTRPGDTYYRHVRTLQTTTQRTPQTPTPAVEPRPHPQPAANHLTTGVWLIPGAEAILGPRPQP